jgi:hypothetical protein
MGHHQYGEKRKRLDHPNAPRLFKWLTKDQPDRLTAFNVPKREINSRNQGAIFVPALAREILYWINSTELEVLAVFVWITFLTSGAYHIVHVPQPDWYCPSPIKSSQSHSHRNASNVPALTVKLSTAFTAQSTCPRKGEPILLGGKWALRTSVS